MFFVYTVQRPLSLLDNNNDRFSLNETVKAFALKKKAHKTPIIHYWNTTFLQILTTVTPFGGVCSAPRLCSAEPGLQPGPPSDAHFFRSCLRSFPLPAERWRDGGGG